MEYCVYNIEKLTLRNNYFRHVICTTDKQQLVLMSLNEDEDIGGEVHPRTDQFIRIEQGTGILELGNRVYDIKDGYAFIVQRGTYHNVINDNNSKMKLYTIYSPPHHPDGEINIYKPEE